MRVHSLLGLTSLANVFKPTCAQTSPTCPPAGLAVFCYFSGLVNTGLGKENELSGVTLICGENTYSLNMSI